MSSHPPRHTLSVCLSKDGDARFLGQLDFLRLVERSLRRSGLPLQYTQGFNPRICLSFTDALPVGVASEGEWIAVKLTEDLEPEQVRTQLAPALPAAVRLVDVRKGGPPEAEGPVRYRLEVTGNARSAAETLGALLSAASDPAGPPEPRAGLVAGEVCPDGLIVALTSVNDRPPRPGPLAEALADHAREAGLPVPGFGTFTKLRGSARRLGDDERWADAAAGGPAGTRPAKRSRDRQPASC